MSKHFYTLAEVNFLKDNEVDLSEDVFKSIKNSFEFEMPGDIENYIDNAFDKVVVEPKRLKK